MSEQRIFLVTLLIGVAVCQGAFVPERSHRYPRSKCSMCGPDHSGELAEQWDSPADSSEQFSDVMLTRPAPHHPITRPLYPRSLSNSHPTISHPIYPLMRAERSPPSEESDKKVLVVYRGDLENKPTEASQSSLVGPLSDKQLEEIVTRAILSAKRQAEEQDSLYRPIRLQNPSLRVNHGEDEAIRQLMMHMRALGPREFPITRDPYTVHGGVTDHWDGMNWQKIGENTEEEHSGIEGIKDEIVGSDEVKKNEEKPQEDMGDTQGGAKDVQEKKKVDPALVEDIEAPPTDEGVEENKSTPAP